MSGGSMNYIYCQIEDYAEWEAQKESDYGSCPRHKHCLMHGWEIPCVEYERVRE